MTCPCGCGVALQRGRRFGSRQCYHRFLKTAPEAYARFCRACQQGNPTRKRKKRVGPKLPTVKSDLSAQAIDVLWQKAVADQARARKQPQGMSL